MPERQTRANSLAIVTAQPWRNYETEAGTYFVVLLPNYRSQVRGMIGQGYFRFPMRKIPTWFPAPGPWKTGAWSWV